MDQQLQENLVDITPATMDDLLAKIQSILSTNSIEDEKVLANIIKSLFYGLWNFDKMINQHYLSTKISQLLLKIPKKNSLVFFQAFITFLHQKWNLIDHHRINKFMQLVRYLLTQAFKTCEKHKTNKKKIDQILLEKVYNFTNERSGLIYHITDIYFETCEEAFPHGATLEELKLFQNLLFAHPNEALRLYIGEQVYEKYKNKIAKKYQHEEDLSKLQKQLLEFSQYFLELAKTEEKELNRKNLYNLVGYAKSPQFSFSLYLKEKKEKQLAEQEKKKKKLSSSKKEEIKKLKAKRKSKKSKTKKIMSVRKFQDKNKMKKGIEEL